MSINNLAKYHSHRISGQNSIAAECLKRLNHGEPMVSPETIEGIRQSSKRLVYRDKCGSIVNPSEMANKYGLKNSELTKLFADNGNDWRKVAKKLPKPVRGRCKYRDKFGLPCTKHDLAFEFGLHCETVAVAFKKHKNDWKAAREELNDKRKAK